MRINPKFSLIRYANEFPWKEGPKRDRLLEALRVPILEYPGFEADDVIGTIARRAEQAGVEVVIVSSDKDMMQLVGEQIGRAHV